ncbi:Hypothetical protein, putative [Bodo saltans]|uniref:Right handed beta helix domain-containing protein n=1 Tax=Bodo saltans TaxID=75058 RepID=A0A0S4JMI0_BODSA|nr:Hypothetical protein, putative [Bodo saltans]|eukprot:CUG91853.1 Hypothetical protein, putative [Bodo saltans]
MAQQPSEAGILESPRAKWARVVITESMQWSVVGVNPTNFIETMQPQQQQAAGDSSNIGTPVVFLLKSGLYRVPGTFTIHRNAPCVVKAEEEGVTFELGDDGDVDSSLPPHQRQQPFSLLRINGKGDVVMQGISFVSLRAGYSCLHADGTGRVCIAECKFSAKVDDSRELSSYGGACVTVSSSVGCFYSTQSEFTSGDVGLRTIDATTQFGGSRDPLSVVLEDAGFGAAVTLDSASQQQLQHGIQLQSCHRPVHLVVDHSAFENISLAALGTNIPTTDPSSTTTNSAYKHHHHTITLQHSTISNCGSPTAAAVILKGHHTLEVLDCTMEQCGAVHLGHSSTCRLMECSLTWSKQQPMTLVTPAADATTSSFRFLVAQDQANVTVEKCEWSLVYNNSSSPVAARWTSTFLTLLSTGHVVVEGNLFQQKCIASISRSNEDHHASSGSVLSSVIVEGSGSPIIRGNRFHASNNEGDEEACSHGGAIVVGLLLGLWHDAKIIDNTFSESIPADATYVSLEDHAECLGIASKLDEDIMEAWVTVVQQVARAEEGTAATTVLSETSHRAATSMKTRSSSSGGKRTKSQALVAQQPPRPPPGVASSSSARTKKNRAAAASTPQPSLPRASIADEVVIDHDQAADDDDAAHLSPSSDAATTIATLRDQVAALKLQLHDARTHTTMTNQTNPSSLVKPPSSKRTTSARPSSAKHSNSRPSTATTRLSRTHSPKHQQQEPQVAEGEDDKIVRVGNHEWNMSRMKAFMQGRLPLAEVRRDAPLDDKCRNMSPKRSNSPTAIYDAWKQSQAEKREEEERLLRKIKDDELNHRRKLTPRQQNEMVHRIHTESIEHLKEVRAAWELDAMEKLQRPRFATMKQADAVAEAEGDFDERLFKDLRGRKLRKEMLMKKYVPEYTSNTRSRAEIEAYASSMHKGHHDAKLIAKLNDDNGLQLKVIPPRSSYKERPSSAKRVRLEDQVAYCASLHTSHRNEQLAEKAARIIGDDCVVRVGARSSSRGPAHS